MACLTAGKASFQLSGTAPKSVMRSVCRAPAVIIMNSKHPPRKKNLLFML
jgi:hypothetical protein